MVRQRGGSGEFFSGTHRHTQLISSAGATSKRAKLIGEKREKFLLGGKFEFKHKNSDGKVEIKQGQTAKKSHKLVQLNEACFFCLFLSLFGKRKDVGGGKKSLFFLVNSKCRICFWEECADKCLTRALF